MTRYIANEANLKMMMNLLRDKSKNIQFEAFHVFKASHICVIAMRIVGLTSDVRRYLWQIRRNPLKSSRSFGGIKTSSWFSLRDFTTTKKVCLSLTRVIFGIPRDSMTII
jgi:hypothetical protein